MASLDVYSLPGLHLMSIKPYMVSLLGTYGYNYLTSLGEFQVARTFESIVSAVHLHLYILVAGEAIDVVAGSIKIRPCPSKNVSFSASGKYILRSLVEGSRLVLWESIYACVKISCQAIIRCSGESLQWLILTFCVPDMLSVELQESFNF